MNFIVVWTNSFENYKINECLSALWFSGKLGFGDCRKISNKFLCFRTVALIISQLIR